MLAHRSRRTLVVAALVGLAALLLLPALAFADGDPASDVLLGEDVFYPYSPTVSPALQKQLNAETASARKAKFPIKVALIASPVDLGVIPDLFDKPQKYAGFLDQEISFQGKQRLLVVMPAGYGVQGVSAAERRAIESLPKPAGKQSDDLARAAMSAVSKLAAAGGHPVGATAPARGHGSGGGSKTAIVIVLVLAAVAAAGALVALRRRQAAAGR